VGHLFLVWVSAFGFVHSSVDTVDLMRGEAPCWCVRHHPVGTLNVRHVSLVLVDFTAVNGEAETLEQLRSLFILRLTTAEQVQIQRSALSDDDSRCSHINNTID